MRCMVSIICHVYLVLAAGWLCTFVYGVQWKVLNPDDKSVTRTASAFSATTLYTFGGEWQGTYSRDLRQFDFFKKTWTSVEVGGTAPARRAGATLTKLASALYLIGGHNENGTIGSIHKYDIITNKWHNVQISGDVNFIPRSGHAACTDGQNRIFVFGGYSDEGLFLNDLYEIHLSSKSNPESNAQQIDATFKLLSTDRTITCHTDLNAGALNPSPKEHASMEIVDGVLYLFGGYSYGGSCGDGMWTFDLKTSKWTALESEMSPPPMEGMSSITMGRSVLFFGGCDFSYNSSRCYNDLWRFDTTTNKWYIIPTADDKPAARAFASIAFLNGGLVLHGGSKMDVRAFGETYQLLDMPCKDPAHTCLGRGTCSLTSCVCSSGYEGHDCGITSAPEDAVKSDDVPFYTEM
ncbi:kelch repeat domain containing protein, putative [Babesia bigemina]|uniref:Kelch repeat domain containing protein, putative n=1 Tax=Babesia bigemina TaxID=5866 RepID=A0A061D6F2_BABBI|nr:kelch repeat domain containing protein, putative [Babesia bigemina]CDR96133.1 kelch repeat domain containing protein, putative [Babesia bigemina]|eukprot:XP_012768319.1 kelch repeat domain containing protein, putative [Babesia bigemina]